MRKLGKLTIPILSLLVVFISLYNSINLESKQNRPDTIFAEGDSIRVSRAWSNYGETSYQLDYSIAKTSHQEAERFRNEDLFEPQVFNANDYWKSIYFQIYFEQKNSLVEITKLLQKIRTESNLDRNEFAKIIVSFVQDVPYTLVLYKQNCEDKTDYSGPCVNKVKYGLYSPLEFLSHLKGDCDTRTLLLYTLFKKFGYNPIIVNSDEYAHSMLALDIQASGEYVLHNGRRHYFWETTSTGWEAGVLPPQNKNKKYWDKTLF